MAVAGAGARGLKTLLLIAGIYSLPKLLENHKLAGGGASVYDEFVEAAFGPDVEGLYAAVSPVGGVYGSGTCASLGEMVLAYSPDDELIEAEQREVMLARLKEIGWVEAGYEGGEESRIVEAVDLSGGHDHVWQDGRQVAGLIDDVVGRAFRGS